MYSATPHHQYVYSPAVPAPRQYSGTSSAFSSSANPDEDWTKISDLAERRRIQNRIAQRNYRKKLKRRLEDLERRAGTSDGTPAEKAQSQAQAQAAGKGNKRQPTAAKAQQQQKTSVSPRPVPTPQFTPPMNNDDEYLFHGGAYGAKRERSTTPPSLFHSYTYPPPEEQAFLTPYPAPAAHAYRPMTTTAAAANTTADAYPEYLATTVPVTLPGMTHFSDALKGDDSFMPYLNYGLVPGMDMNGANPYDGANPHTPPLSHSFDHSTNCSDAGYEYPHTPLSMPSPGMIQN